MKTPILLIHGLGAHPKTMIGVEKYISYCGHEELHYVSYPADTENLNYCVNHVEKWLKENFEEDQEFIVIGQSMGGVIGHRLSENWNIKLLITIGSPLKGARVLFSLEEKIPEKIKEIFYKPMYDDLKHLTNFPLPEPGCDYHCITMAWPFTNFDGCVYVDESSYKKENHTHLAIADHRTIFANPRLWMAVEKIIKEKLKAF